MPKPIGSKFNGSIHGPQYQPSGNSRWSDVPLEIGMDVEILSGQYSGQTAVITKIDRPKKQREAPKITVRLCCGSEIDASLQQWRRKTATAPIWSGPSEYRGRSSLDE